MNTNKKSLISGEKAVKAFNILSSIHLTDEDFSTYLEGKADPINLARINIHLQQCDDCREEMEMLKSVVSQKPGEPDPKRAAELEKLLDFYPIHRDKKTKSTYVFDPLSYGSVGFAIQGETESEWIPFHCNHEQSYKGFYKKDSKGNLIFKFIVPGNKPKLITLVTITGSKELGKTKEFTRDGDNWIAEIIIPYKIREENTKVNNLKMHVDY